MNGSKLLPALVCAVFCAFQIPVQAAPPRSVQAEVKPIPKTDPAAQRLPRSVLAHLPKPDARLAMPPLDRTAIDMQDALPRSGEKALRIGVVRNLAEASPVGAKNADGQWQALPDGSHVWRMSLTAESAFGIRVHIGQIQLPEGCAFTVYETADPARLRGPYALSDINGRNEFWTGTVFADAVTVECHAPAGTPTETVRFVVDRIVHVYRDPLSIAKEGGCNIDLACHPSWASTGNAVAGIGSISDADDYMWCTGCLLNDQVPSTYVDYFMTANHCVGSQTEANDTEFYWFFQTASCGGSPPSLSAVTQTGGGADYLAGRTRASGNDFAFLRLRTAAPGGATYAGWSIDAPGAETLAGIHHPDGAFKRISFGSPAGSDANYWEVQWSSGVTEPGSSGSPLFNSSQQFIGQLWGGGSSCATPYETDEYGRFNVTYAVIQGWLNGENPPPESTTYFSAGQTVRTTGAGWSRTFVMDLTNFQNLAVQDGYQSYTTAYHLYYDIWNGIYVYDYNLGAFSALTWLMNLDL